MISRLVVWSNGMVMCFDRQGEQMPNYQGSINEVLDRALNMAALDGAACFIGDWKNGTIMTTNQSLRCLLKYVKGGE